MGRHIVQNRIEYYLKEGGKKREKEREREREERRERRETEKGPRETGIRTPREDRERSKMAGGGQGLPEVGVACLLKR